jgi:hypothetical protein
MGDLVLKGATSGQITLTPTGVAGTNTLTLPARTGNIITSADSGTVTGTMLASATVAQSNLAANVAGNGPAFSAYVNGAQTVGNSSWTRMSINTTSFDTAIAVNTSTYRFTAPVAGYYYMSGQVSFVGSSTGYAQMALYVNNSATNNGNAAPNNTNVGAQVSLAAIVLLAVNDYVELYGWQNSGGNLNTQNSSTQNYLSGVLVRTV